MLFFVTSLYFAALYSFRRAISTNMNIPVFASFNSNMDWNSEIVNFGSKMVFTLLEEGYHFPGNYPFHLIPFWCITLLRGVKSPHLSCSTNQHFRFWTTEHDKESKDIISLNLLLKIDIFSIIYLILYEIFQ